MPTTQSKTSVEPGYSPKPARPAYQPRPKSDDSPSPSPDPETESPSSGGKSRGKAR